MIMKSFLYCAAFLLASGNWGVADDAIYLAAGDSKALIAKEGQKVTVYGTTAESSKSPSGTNFVNFEEAEFYLVTFKTDLTEFSDGEPSELYDGKRLTVSGVMSIYQGKPQIKLTSPDQIGVLEEGEEFPSAVVKKEKPEEKPVVKSEPTPETKPAVEEPKRKPPVDPSEFFK
mgnify:CR=1 FL=1|tara:strand:+ start:26 stop:544 length:519 start_codon:yes stop_codon:yes gene_type:complete